MEIDILRNKLLKGNVIDHNILYQRIPLNKKKTSFANVYSLNIAQISHIRTMVIWNKIHCYLKSSTHLMSSISKKLLNDLFDTMPLFIEKYNLKDIKIDEGSKLLIVNEELKSDLKAILQNTVDIEFIYLRKYIPKNNTKSDSIFRERFAKVNYHYFDIIFREETIEEYSTRVRNVLKSFMELAQNQDNVLFLLQEINPILDFLTVIEESQFRQFFKVVDPTFHNADDRKHNEKTFTRSVNVLLSHKFAFSHRIERRPADHLIHFFSSYGRTNEKNEYQNLKYYITKYRLSLYNIHGNMTTKRYSINQLLGYLEGIDKNIRFILMGDLNLKMSADIYKYFTEKLFSYDIQYDLRPLPNSKNIYEGCIYRT